MNISFTHKDIEINGTLVTKVIRREKGYGFGARWEYKSTRYTIDGQTFKNMKSVREYLTTQTQPQHTEIKIVGVGEATKPALNPAIANEMRALGIKSKLYAI